MATTSGSRRSRAERDRLATEVVRLRFELGYSAQEVANKLKLAHSSEVSRLIVHARRHRLFAITYLPGDTGTRDRSLEQSLEQRFSLRKAIVVDAPASGSDNHMEADDRLHASLGQAAGEYLRELIGVVPPSHIAVGGGRGPYYTAQCLAESPLELDEGSLARLRVTSLTGRMSTPVWSKDNVHLTLDADDVVSMVSLALKVRWANQYRLNLPLACDSPAVQAEYLAADGRAMYISKEKWSTAPEFVPDLAIVGIGAVDGGHRFCPPFDDILSPINDSLEELNGLAKKLKARIKLSPVGDVSNHLIPIDPKLLGYGLTGRSASDFTALQREIETINRCTLSVDLEQLRRIRTVVAVAGGSRFKRHAIYSFLKRDDVSIHVLCTDSDTAEEICALDDA